MTATAGPVVKPATLSSASRAGVVAAAQEALAHRADYEYDQVRPMPSTLFGTPPIIIDCSAFATLCYKAAGLPNPNGGPYDGDGNTTTLAEGGEATTDPEPGDLAFYEDPAHVTVYIGGGQCITMGQPGDPQQIPVGYRSVTQYRTYSGTPTGTGSSSSSTSTLTLNSGGGPGALGLLLFVALTLGSLWLIHQGIDKEAGA